jgi:hypothetical protein
MNVNDRIRAVHVLQRFVRMSRTLLPIYFELTNKKELSISEEQKLIKIKKVYNNFNPNPETSNYLINSDILKMIQSVFHWVVSQKGQTPESFHDYNLFIKESDRLINTWNKQMLN